VNAFRVRSANSVQNKVHDFIDDLLLTKFSNRPMSKWPDAAKKINKVSQ
jgi:hypothetical protein